MKIKDYNISAVIFDLDGTIVESNSIWKDVDVAFFNKRGLTCPDDYAQAIAHIGLHKAAVYTKERFNLDDDVEEIVKEWTDMVKVKYAEEVFTKAYFISFLDKLDEENIPYCLATANSPACYIPCLKHNNIYHRFKYILDVTTLNTSKDHPKIYLECANKLNIDPSYICVIEDIEKALKVAGDAGFITIAIDDFDNEDIKEAKIKASNIYISSYKELL